MNRCLINYSVRSRNFSSSLISSAAANHPIKYYRDGFCRLNNNKAVICFRMRPRNSGGGNLLEVLPSHIGASSKMFHSYTNPLMKDPESTAEKTVNLLKENIISKTEDAKESKNDDEKSKAKVIPDVSVKSDSNVSSSVNIDEKQPEQQQQQVQVKQEARLTLWQKIVHECKHYYHGFKLLYFETKIAYRLLKRVLKGEQLTRRERKQFTRTAADLFRLVPFSVFIIVPFMEFTLPIFLKLFPNMLPSTFKEASKEQEKLKLRLKAKLEMAKFLQDTLEETALSSGGNKDGKSTEHSLNHKFAEFMKKIRSKGEQPSSEEILKYSALFENELTLDNLSRQQLIALCQILDVSTLANIPPDDILRFQLRMKFRTLEADDKMIIKEGVDSMDIEELQQACRERGMRALGVSEFRLRNQLEQWLDLHINRKVPISLLMLSRAMYLPENLAPEEIIKSTISALPKSIETATIAKIAEATGSGVDNQVKLEVLKNEEAQIKLENESKKKESEKSSAAAAAAAVPAMKPAVATGSELAPEKDLGKIIMSEKEKLIDKAQEELTPTDIKEINAIIENLPISEEKQVKAEIFELKKDLDEYKEDIKEVEQVKLTETKSAKNLGKRVQKLLGDMDKLMVKLESETAKSSGATTSPAQPQSGSNKNAVSIDELMATIKKIRGVSNDVKEKKLKEVLSTLDKDHDGKIDDLTDVLKVFDMIEQENVKVTKDQLGKILTLLEKEKIIEKEEEQQEQAAKTANAAAASATAANTNANASNNNNK